MIYPDHEIKRIIYTHLESFAKMIITFTIIKLLQVFARSDMDFIF